MRQPGGVGSVCSSLMVHAPAARAARAPLSTCGVSGGAVRCSSTVSSGPVTAVTQLDSTYTESVYSQCPDTEFRWVPHECSGERRVQQRSPGAYLPEGRPPVDRAPAALGADPRRIARP